LEEAIVLRRDIRARFEGSTRTLEALRKAVDADPVAASKVDVGPLCAALKAVADAAALAVSGFGEFLSPYLDPEGNPIPLDAAREKVERASGFVLQLVGTLPDAFAGSAFLPPFHLFVFIFFILSHSRCLFSPPKSYTLVCVSRFVGLGYVPCCVSSP
jgi:hypothetical protein